MGQRSAVPILKWEYYQAVNKKFTKFVPSTPGVYYFYTEAYSSYIKNHFEVLYIGVASRSIQDRFRAYLSEKDGKKKSREMVEKMFADFQGNLSFACAEVNAYDLSLIEQKLIEVFDPIYNKELKLREKDFYDSLNGKLGEPQTAFGRI